MARIPCIWRAEANGYNLYDMDGKWLTLFFPFVLEPNDSEIGTEEYCEWDDDKAFRWSEGNEYVTYKYAE
jgi:hypothetical protein